MKLFSLTAALLLTGATAAYAAEPAAAPAPLTADSKAPVVKSADGAVTQVAIVNEGGKMTMLRGPDAAKAPAGAMKFSVKAFPLGNGNAFREITLPKGTVLPAPKNGDTIVYVVKGHVNVKLGTETAQLAAGDTWRKIAPQDNVYTSTDDAVIVETDVK